MRLCDSESEGIQKRLATKDKLYYAPMVYGFVETATYEFMRCEGFSLITLPELSIAYTNKRGSISFELNSEQFELNASNAMRLSVASAVYDKVFTVSRAFRKEEKVDRTHLTEFKIIEAEWKSHCEEELFLFIEKYLGYIVERFDQFISDKKMDRVFDAVHIDLPLTRITYDEALRMLRDRGIEPGFDDGYFDLDISEQISKPCCITYYPQKCSWRAKSKDTRLAYAYNLVLPCSYGELADFSVRETDFEFYEKKFKEAGISDFYEWYLLGIKADESQRVGFGLGLERLCSWLMRLDDIGDLLCFPRYPNILKGGG